MADYGHELRLGVMLEPEADWGRAVPALAELTEQVGLDLVSLADHPYWTDRLDAMTLLTAIAARTSRLTLFPNLANLPRREPLMLARAAATLDTISGGRFELGLATGAQQLWGQIVADGGPQRSAGESVAAWRRPSTLSARPGPRPVSSGSTGRTTSCPRPPAALPQRTTSASGSGRASGACSSWPAGPPTAGCRARPPCPPNS